MIPFSPLKNTRSLLKNLGCALAFFAMSANVQGAVTDLANSPLTVSSTVLPNLMFILDDSGSMAWTYLPDDALFFDGKYGYASSQCNGVYYNPDITYTPPVTSTGTSYANSSFTGAWTDGYNTGAGTTNLSSSFRPTSTYSSEAAYYYKYTGTQTSADPQTRSRLKDYYNTGSTFYKECISSSSAGSGATATITISGSGSSQISGVTVNGQQIMSGTTSSSSTSSTVAGYVETKIDACTSSISGTCTVQSYSADNSSGSNVITINAPLSAGDITYLPLVTFTSGSSMTATATAFSGYTPANVFTKVTVSSTSGDTAAGMPADERQNFANWYSYYRTRMNMMKTASGLAFNPIDSSFRIAFMTINNNVNPDVLDFAPFDATQRSNWYAKLYGATPNNATPLREALARVGRIYARKLTSLYGVSLADPIQHSCQKNFTMLSTDGFWNGNAGFKLDGTTAVGNQDGTEPRPYNDGASTSITKTTTQLQMSQTQITRSTSQLVQTTNAYQTRTSTLQKQISQLQTRTSTLQKQLSQLKSSTSTLQTRTGTLQRRTYNGSSWSSWGAAQISTATITITAASSASVSRLKVNGTTDIMDSSSNSSSTTSTVASNIASQINSCTSWASGNCDISGYSASASGNVVTITGPANNGDTLSITMNSGSMTSTSTAFVANPTPSCTWGNYTDCQYSWGAWSNAASCTTSYSTNTSNGQTWSGNGTGCQYTAWTTAANASSCTGVAQSAGPAFTVGTATLCSTAVTSAWANTASACTAGTDGSGVTTECRYGSATAWSGVQTCTATAQDYTNVTARECQTAVTTTYATTTTDCTATTATDTSGYTTQCQYGAWSAWSTVTASGSTATLTLGGTSSTSVSGITVNSKQIMDSGTSSYTDPTQLATAIAGKINACTSGYNWSSNCTITGYSASASGSVVTISNSSSITYTPSISKSGSMTATATAFAANVGTCTAAAQSAGPTSYTVHPARECQTNATSVGVASCTPSGSVTCSSVTTGPTDVSSCTAASASSGNSYTATTCSTRVKTAAQGVSTCTAASASTTNGGVATVCNTSTTTASVATCNPQTASGFNSYKTITCSAPVTSAGTSDTLADVAEYYYVTDLRTTALGNCTSGSSGNTLCATPDAAGVDTYNNVLPSGEDKATWQHMTTYTLGLGTRGNMAYSSPSYMSDSSGDFYSVLMGSLADSTATPPICSWQTNGTTCNWPIPAFGTKTAVDDLWHAAVNGRGTYYSAADPAELSTGLSGALGNIATSSQSMAAVTVSNPNMDSDDNFTFGSNYNTNGWDGNIVREQIDKFTGAIITDSDGKPIDGWSARGMLDLKASRTISTYDSTNAYGNKLKSFTYANLTTAEKAYFDAPNISTTPPSGTTGLTQYLCASSATCLTTTNKTNAAGTNLVNYLRGDRTNEGALNDNSKYYRMRSHVLGDIADSSAAYVKAPMFGYPDAGYGVFKGIQAARQGMVYVGANDGMLHAFYAYGGDGGDDHDPVQYMDTATGSVVASSGTGIIQVNGGDEAWGYIPSMVLPKLYTLADKNYASKHQYFVDGSPVIGDICPTVPSTACAGSQWKTILVGGLNGGGKGYYALDITNPAAPKALWEFNTTNAAPYGDANIGYSYGNPKIVKLNDANGTWAVLVTSGYNNADGVGRLYVLNANTGALIRTISTGVGSAGTPSGLAKIATMVSTSGNTDNMVVQVYGGDMLGNLWRFDVNGNVGAAGYDAQLLATLKTAGSVIQPITSKPEIGNIDGKVVVYVGTGRYLGTSDLADTTQQSMYAIKDPLLTTSVPGTAVHSNVRAASFIRQTVTTTTCPDTTICASGQSVRTGSSNVVNFSTDNGWYIDFPDSGERANTNPLLAFGTLAFTTNVPQVSSCSSGGYSFDYFLDSHSGAPVVTSGIIGKKIGNTLTSGITIIQLPNGDVKTIISVTGSPASSPAGATTTTTCTKDCSSVTDDFHKGLVDVGGIIGRGGFPSSGSSGSGASWRELIDQ